jgi:hypothetical protein
VIAVFQSADDIDTPSSVTKSGFSFGNELRTFGLAFRIEVNDIAIYLLFLWRYGCSTRSDALVA